MWTMTLEYDVFNRVPSSSFIHRYSKIANTVEMREINDGIRGSTVYRYRLLMYRYGDCAHVYEGVCVASTTSNRCTHIDEQQRHFAVFIAVRERPEETISEDGGRSTVRQRPDAFDRGEGRMGCTDGGRAASSLSSNWC